jgi:hypothetical protein
MELLEDRVVPSVIEDFSAGLGAYTTILRYAPNAAVVPGAGHDGVSNALDKLDGFEWLVRNDPDVQVQQGETLSAWLQINDLDGRAYFGFGARPNLHNDFLRTGGTLSLVAAPNSGQLLLENNSGFGHSTLASAPAAYTAGGTYRLEVVWGVGGAITGNLYDSDGVSLLSTVSASSNVYTSGGIAFRAFGSDKYFDTIEAVPTGNGASPSRHGIGAHHASLHSGPRSGPGPAGGLLDPFQYQSVPGTGIQIWLARWDSLQQVAIVGDVVGLAATNRSENHGTEQYGWGPIVQGLFSNNIPVQTPMLQEYIFRQRPGERTTIIGRSDVKHFFLATGVDGQHLRPGESDTYDAIGQNAAQDLFSPQEDVNPVTGDITNQALDYFGENHAGGPRNLDGLNQRGSHTYSSRIDRLLQVNVADLDPSQNPSGTVWYLAANIFVPGDEDVTHTSRWVRIQPSFNGQGFSFTYPNGPTGQYNVRTIPGLAGLPPTIISQNPSGSTTGPVSQLEVTFSQRMNAASFTPDKITSFTGPNGPITVTGVALADPTNTRFVISFPPQASEGSYQMSIGPDIQDENGLSMPAPYIAQFTIVAPFNYAASANAFEKLEISGQPGTVPLPFTNGTFYADDDYGTISLGGDQFNFAGATYAELFVSSNGLITFGSGNNAYVNTDLTDSPSQAAISPLWTDWIKTASDPGGPMILYKFEDVPGGRRLIIEWNQIRHFSGTSNLYTFQAILSLNTDVNAGDIVFNYVNLNSGTTDPHRDGLTSTVGIKDAGPQGARRLLVSFNQPNDLVGSGKAILITQSFGGAARPSPGFIPEMVPGRSTDGVKDQVAAVLKPSRSEEDQTVIQNVDRLFAAASVIQTPTASVVRPAPELPVADSAWTPFDDR